MFLAVGAGCADATEPAHAGSFHAKIPEGPPLAAKGAASFR